VGGTDFRNGSPQPVVFIRQDSELVTATPDGIAWRDAATGRLFRTDPIGGVAVLTVSPDGAYLAVGGYEQARLWNISTRSPVGPVLPHRNTILATAFSPDSRRLLTAGMDNSVKVWSIPNGQLLGPVVHQPSSVMLAGFLADGKSFVTVAGLLRAWSSPPGNPRDWQLPLVGGGVTRAAFSADGRYVIPTSSAFKGWGMRGLQVYETATGRPAGPVLDADGIIHDAGLAPDRTQAALLVTGLPSARSAGGHQLQLWDWRTGKRPFPSMDLPAMPRSLAYRPDGKQLAVRCTGGKLLLIDPRTSRIQRHLAVESGPYDSFPGEYINNGRVGYSPDGRLLLAWGSVHVQAVKMWDPATGRSRPALLPNQGCHDVQFSPDLRLAVTASYGATARVWDVRTARELASLPNHPDGVVTAQFSPDGHYLLTACRDGMARLWNWKKGLLICPPFEHEPELFDAVFLPGGPWLATASRDGTARLWEWHTGKPLTPPLPVGGMCLQVLANRKASYLAAAGFTGKVHLFHLGDLHRADDISLANLSLLAEVVSGRRVDRTGVVKLEAEEWLARWRRAEQAGVAGPRATWMGRAARPTEEKAGPSPGETPVPAPRTAPFQANIHYEYEGLAFSPDGKLLAAACPVYSEPPRTQLPGEVAVWDAATGRHCFSLPTRGQMVDSVAFSRGGKWLAAAGSGFLTVWDAKTRKQAFAVSLGPYESVTGMARIDFSPEGALAAGCGDGTVKLWDPRTGKVRRVLRGRARGRPQVAFNKSGTLLAAACARDVTIWKVKTGRVWLTLDGPANIFALDFSPEGWHLVTSSQDGMIRVWDVTTGKVVMSQGGAGQGLFFGVVFTPDGKCVAGASTSGVVKILDAFTGEQRQTLRHKGQVFAVAISPGGSRLAAAGRHQTLKVWDRDTGNEIFTTRRPGSVLPLPKVQYRYQNVAFSPDGKHLAFACQVFSQDQMAFFPGEVLVWDAVTGRLSFSLKTRSKRLDSVAFSRDGKWLAAAGSGTVTVWDANNRKEAFVFSVCPPNREMAITRIDFSPDGSLAAACADGTVKLWEVGTGKVRRALRGQTGYRSHVAFNKAGSLLASACGPAVKVWDMKTGRVQITLKGHANQVFSVDFSPDGRHLVSASQNGVIKVWNVVTGKPIMSRAAEGNQIQYHGVVFTPDGKRLAAGSNSNVVKILDALTGKEQLVLYHTGRVFGVALDRDGARLAAGSELGTIKLWKIGVAPTGTELFAARHPDSAPSVTVMPPRPSPPPDYRWVGQAAPEIEGVDIGGKKFKLSDYRGKVVLLDFWGHW
jgi:WD40 repeat protein